VRRMEVTDVLKQVLANIFGLSAVPVQSIEFLSDLATISKESIASHNNLRKISRN